MVHVQRMENALQLLQDHQAQIDQLTREMENMKTGSEVTPVGGTVTDCTVRLTGSGITAIPPVGVTYLQKQLCSVITFWKESTLYQRFSSITQ